MTLLLSVQALGVHPVHAAFALLLAVAVLWPHTPELLVVPVRADSISAALFSSFAN